MNGALLLTWPWPWWLGAVALASVVVGTWWVLGHPLGVSGSWLRVVTARRQARLEAVEQAVASNEAAFLAAMMAETQAQFGVSGETAAPLAGSASSSAPATVVKPRVSWTVHATFLVFLVVGGTVGAYSRGVLSPGATLGPDFEALFGAGWPSFAVLVVGGALVGMGTRMAGGCTSGHGLSGLSRLQLGSLISTAAFFGAGVVTSLLLSWGLR